MLRIVLLLIFQIFLVVNYIHSQDIKYEMRGAWIATIFNIDWPSSSQLSIEQQQRELIQLLDEIKECKLNTVFLQVRPNGDALYQSSIEPPSHWICGSQNSSLDYDPLQFAVDQCRERGLSIHVWLNPYRVWNDVRNLNNLSESHLYYSNPELFIRVKNILYFNPALKASREHLRDVVKEIITSYDVDAIHMDDYFYPYPCKESDLNDQFLFLADKRGFTSIEDWRRNNVNLMVQEIREVIDTYNPRIEFGISPFGVWRNKIDDVKGSDTRSSYTNYDHLYADVLYWINKKWINYVVPQIYWHIGFSRADYITLVDWWEKHTKGVKLYIGHAAYKVNKYAKESEWRSADEIIRQIEYNRMKKRVRGSVFFSAKYLRKNHPSELFTRLQDVYQYYSLQPENIHYKRFRVTYPVSPLISVIGDSLHLTWGKNRYQKSFILYKVPKDISFNSKTAGNIIEITGSNRIILPNNYFHNTEKYNYYITSLSYTLNESRPVKFSLRN